MSQIALNLFTLRDFIKSRSAIRETLSRLRDIGYEHVQIGSLNYLNAKEFKKLLDDFGMSCCARHVGLFQNEDEALRSIEEHQILGCTYSAISHMRADSAAGYVELAGRADKWAQLFKKHGITLAYHNHAHEFQKFDGKLALDIIFENSNTLQSEIDTYWVHYGGGVAHEWIEKLKNRLPLIHLKDYAIVDGQPTFAEVGEGNLNFSKILESAKAAGTRWFIVEQDLCQRDPFESVKISLENLQKMGLK